MKTTPKYNAEQLEQMGERWWKLCDEYDANDRSYGGDYQTFDDEQAQSHRAEIMDLLEVILAYNGVDVRALHEEVSE